MIFAVKCSSHYPGYEVAHAPSVDVLKSQTESWRSCKVEQAAIVEIPDGFNANATYEDGTTNAELQKKLTGWTKEFTDKH